MQNQALQNPHYRANNSYHGHDMSMTRKFSSSVGQLLPVYQDLLYPGDKVRFSTEMFSRTEEITSPALIELNEHVRWFFVPIQQLYQFAPSTFFGIDDIETSFADNAQVIPDVPFFDFKATLDTSVNDYAFNTVNDLIGDQTTIPYIDEYGIPQYYNYCRLGELLGYGNIFITDPRILFDDSDNDKFSINVNFMYAAAYQKIWYDHFRISDRSPNDPTAYNVDKFYNNNTVNTNIKLFRLHYVPYQKDYFTSMKVSPLINGGSIGMIEYADLAKVNQWLNSTYFNAYGNPTLVNDKTVAANPKSTATNNITFTSLSNAMQSSLNTASLRSMFAVEKLAQITREAAKHYDAQVLAHFGVEVPQGISGECFKLGSDDAVVQIQDVTAFAGTEQTALGDLAGKGVAYSENRDMHEFTAPCHGVLMAVFYALPSVDYRSTGIEKINTYRTREDFFVKSLENLGQQPVFEYELNGDTRPSHVGNMLGWNWRYMESKVKYNVLNGNFNTTSKNWSAAKLDTGVGINQSSSFYYCDPRFLDTIMAVSFEPKKTDAFEPFGRDPLKHMFKFHVYKSSQMSPYSLPQL